MIANLELAIQQVREGKVKAMALLSATTEEDEVWYGAVTYAPCMLHGMPELLMPHRMLTLQIDEAVYAHMQPVEEEEMSVVIIGDDEDDEDPQDLLN